MDAEHLLIAMGTAKFEKLCEEVAAFYSGADNAPTKEQILKRIKEVFKCEG